MEPSLFIQESLVIALRMFVDVFLLLFARRKTKEHKQIVSRTFEQGEEILTPIIWSDKCGPSSSAQKEKGISIVSAGYCEIDYLGMRILLSPSCSHADSFSPCAYIDIAGRGAYGALVLRVPFEVDDVSRLREEENVEVTLIEDGMEFVLQDHRDKPASEDEFKVSIHSMIAIQVHRDCSGIVLNIPIKPQLRTIGQPWIQTDRLPTTGPDSRYFPAIGTLEVALKNLPPNFEFSTLGLAPAPEFRSEAECRWISRTQIGSRPHSSITCELSEKGARARSENDQITGGFAVGLWTAVIVTVMIDLAWTGVNFISAIISQSEMVR